MSNFFSSLLDTAIVPGFSRIGFIARSRLNHWDQVSSYDLTGKVVVITGPTSGLGKECVRILAPTGAQLVLVARNKEKCEDVISTVRTLCTGPEPVCVVAEMGDLVSVGKAAREIASRFSQVFAVVHNAGALLNSREVSPQGIEQTVASHVLGPHLLTTILLPNLIATQGRVVTVSSGGMYSAELPNIDGKRTLEMRVDSYNGSKQYAIAKRAQVTLNEMWATKERSVHFDSMHPGWADTPGVQESIPAFQRITKPILRSPAQGADTIAWLAAVQPIPGASGSFWSDREVRSIHKLPTTRRSDNAQARTNLWNWCNQIIASYVSE
ncbi:MAG: SDR family NAD(P)-dependent oxidoreductase [Ilumatobacteraceae bacterium]|jgi:NAD(P)-dependent dehydrogenase (short-subunit alcohol dehydrogenase family)|nr:SDR family NAD(P)-dependent oxidoreductase [Ilumatobacteraceae bacterium]